MPKPHAGSVQLQASIPPITRRQLHLPTIQYILSYQDHQLNTGSWVTRKAILYSDNLFRIFLSFGLAGYDSWEHNGGAISWPS